MPSKVVSGDMESFAKYLTSCRRVFALCGAGLSASSGLATFRGAGGLWKTHDAMTLATPEAFNCDPSLVWQFYAMRRYRSAHAKPNAAHYALAEYARRNRNFLMVSQNVDGLSPRVLHPPDQLKLLHGSLFDLCCTEFFCDYKEHNNYSMSLSPALSKPPTPEDDLDENVTQIPIKDLPHCPKCEYGLLRPGVVWFGETLPSDVITDIDDWLMEGSVDLCLVIGTSGVVYPAAQYVARTKARGAKIAVINMDPAENDRSSRLADWYFQGDAAKIIPQILAPIIGEVEVPTDNQPFPERTVSGGPSKTFKKVSEGVGYY